MELKGPGPVRPDRESVIWVDHSGALLVDPAQGADAVADVISRRPGESSVQLAARVVEQVETSDRVFVIGPAPSRLEFEREFVTIVKAPERLVDVDPADPRIAAAGERGRQA